MSEAYLRAIQEVQQWLRDAALEHNIYVLLDSAYDDLDAISKVTDAELDDMVAIFKTDYNRSAMREHVLKLRSKGIAAYRAQVAEQQRQIDALLADTHDADGWAASASASSSSSPSSSSAAAVVAAPAVSSAASASASDPPAAQGPAPSPPSQADAAAAAASRPQAAASASARASVVVSPAEGVAPALADAARRPQPPHEMSGFLSLRCASVFGSEWVDRFCVFRDERLSWFKSRRDVEAEGSLHVSAVTGARKVDEQTWVLSQEGCEFEVSCDEAGGLAPWVPVLSYFADVARYVEQRGKSFSVSSLPSQRSQIESKRSRTDADVLPRLESGYTPKQERLYKQLLQQGGEFKKYKYNSATKRLIWVTEEMDKLVWGDRDRTEVRGFLRVSLIRTVESGRGKDRLKIFIHTQPRTLELEARDEYEHSDWLAAFSFLIKFHKTESDALNERFRDPQIVIDLRRSAAEYVELLKRGEIFKKYRKGSHTVRHVALTPDLLRVQWSDLEPGEIRGFILLRDVADVQSYSESGPSSTKFQIRAVKRNVDLDAKDVMTKFKWVTALQFVLRHFDYLALLLPR